MKKGIFVTMSFFFCSILLGQQSQDEENSYFPLTKGISKTLTWYKSKYREVVKDTITLEGKIYTEVAQIFPPDETINMYYRKSNDTVYYFNEAKKKDVPFFSIKPIEGETTANGTVKRIDARIRTPKGRLDDLLEIEMVYSNGNKDRRFYKKGLGLVAVKNNNKLICYYIPD